MEGQRSRESAIEFLEYVAQKGLMSPVTARARKAAVTTVLAILDNREAQDVTVIKLDDVMERFSHLHGKEYNPDTLRTYRSRVKSALEDFANYVKSPLAFKPSVQSRERRSNPTEATASVSKGTSTNVPVAPEAGPQTGSVTASMVNTIIPIQIRKDLVVYVQGLPFDLTLSEAKKVANVIQAMAMSE